MGIGYVAEVLDAAGSFKTVNSVEDRCDCASGDLIVGTEVAVLIAADNVSVTVCCGLVGPVEDPFCCPVRVAAVVGSPVFDVGKLNGLVVGKNAERCDRNYHAQYQRHAQKCFQFLHFETSSNIKYILLYILFEKFRVRLSDFVLHCRFFGSVAVSYLVDE